MTKRAKIEFWVFGIVVLAWVVVVIVAANAARAAVRDDLRQTDMEHLKIALEKYNNEFEHYVAAPAGAEACTKSTDGDSWLFGDQSPLLLGKFTDALPHDVREGRGRWYTYCATDMRDGKAFGYYMQAMLEVPRSEGLMFDEDENRKYYYRIVSDNNKILYVLCGGEEEQCDS